MKPLADISIFKEISARVYEKKADHCFSSRERHHHLIYVDSMEDLSEMLLCCTLACRTRSWTGDYHKRVRPPFLSITLIHSGETAVRIGEDFFLAEEGDLILFPPYGDYEYMTFGNSERSAVLFAGKSLLSVLESSGLKNRYCIQLQHPEKVEEYFRQISDTLSEGFRFSARRALAGICFELLQYLSVPEDSVSIIPALKIATEWIALHFSEPLTMDQLAKKAGISVASLTRLFRRYLKTTPYRYLISYRMRYAEYLLKKQTFSIKEVADKAGYRNPLNFSTEFRKYYFCSPREFIQKMQ